jgi:hypothetical protein
MVWQTTRFLVFVQDVVFGKSVAQSGVRPGGHWKIQNFSNSACFCVFINEINPSSCWALHIKISMAQKSNSNFNVDPALRQVVDSMIRKSPTFAAMVGKLPIKTPALTVTKIGSGATVMIDLQQLKNLYYQNTLGKKSPMTLERVIGHELSHAFYHE